MTKQELRWIMRLWKPFRGYAALILGLTLVSTVVLISLPLVLKSVFDGLQAGLTETSLVTAVLLYLGLGTLDWALVTGLIFLRGSMNLRFESAARGQAYAHLVRHSASFFQRFRTGDLVTRLTDDVSEKLSWFICSGIFRAFAATCVVVFAVTMMVRLDPFLTLFTVGPLPALIFLFIRTGTVLDDRFEQVQERISDLNGALEACFSGIRVVKGYGRESAEERTFARFAAASARAEVEAAKSRTLIDSLFGHVWQLGVVVVLLAGGVGVMNGRLTLGTFVAFDAYVLLLIFPMFDIGTLFVRGRQSAVSIGRLRELEETSPEILEAEGAVEPVSPLRGHLRFESVSYSYARTAAAHERRAGPLLPFDTKPRDPSSGRRRNRAPDLSAEVSAGFFPAPLTDSERIRALPHADVAEPFGPPARIGEQHPPLPLEALAAMIDISFDVGPGEIIAVVGTVGAGKSTLLRLLPRLVDPVAGRILIDGVDLRSLPLATLRAAVGYVPQEAVLFTGTIRENVRFGRSEVPDERIEAACEVARLGKDLATFAEGLETRIGVRGVTLSGGQKQRVALARALAGQPKILVLDDVTAALDAETETSLWEELYRVLPELATLVVTHRTATLERADRILVLDRGRLVEQGSHAELSDRGAVYRSIYRRHVLEERVGVEGEAESLAEPTSPSARHDVDQPQA